MAYDLVVLGIRGHPVPESRREGWRAFSDDSMEAFGHGAIRFSHLGDLRQHGTLSLPLASLHLLDSVPYRATFLLSERLAIRGRALGRLLRALLCRFHGIRFVFSELKYFFTSSLLAFQSASLDPCCRDCSQPSEPAFSMGFESSSIRPPFRPILNTSLSYKSPNFSNHLPTGILNRFLQQYSEDGASHFIGTSFMKVSESIFRWAFCTSPSFGESCRDRGEGRHHDRTQHPADWGAGHEATTEAGMGHEQTAIVSRVGQSPSVVILYAGAAPGFFCLLRSLEIC